MNHVLSLKQIGKIYPNGKIANQDISIDIEERTIHAIVGENGAGKSTLVNIIFGVHQQTEGKMFFRGKEVSFSSPNEAISSGIGMVHQHLMLAPELTVAENMLLGMEPTKKGGLFLDYPQMVKKAKEVSDRYGLAINPNKLVKDIPIGIRQRVEILKSLLRNAEVLILDEPTAVLTPQEVEVLFVTLKKLRDEGKTILFISHKLHEVKEISDRITIMKDTKVVVTKEASLLHEREIARLMVGRDVQISRIPATEKRGEVLLSLEGVNYIDSEGIATLKNIEFDLQEGEILGIAGVEGNGQSELSRAITGLLTISSGSIKHRNLLLNNLTVREVRESGIAHIPEDRMKTLLSIDILKKPFLRGYFSLQKRLLVMHIP